MLLFKKLVWYVAALMMVAKNASSSTSTSSIIKGVDAPIDRYPYSVMLRQTQGRRQQICAGSLIAPDIVMTAAHCDQQHISLFEAVINPHFTNTEVNVETKRITSIYKHPEYGLGANWANDLMLLRLESPTQQSWVRLNTNPLQPIPGLSMTIIGWGTREVGFKKPPSVLQEQDGIKVVTNRICKERYEKANLPVLDNMLCVTNDTSCQGDSGGPLLIKNDNGGDIQIGVISWAIGCGDEGYPGVHTRISYVFDWIERTICEISDFVPWYMSCSPTENPTIYQSDRPSVMPSILTSRPSVIPSWSPTKMPTPTPAPTKPSVDILIRIKTDNWPIEIGWKLIGNNGTIDERVYGDYRSIGNIDERIAVESGSNYTLFMTDSGKDGICCLWGSGSVSIYLGNGAFYENTLGYSDGSYKEFGEIQFVASEDGIIKETVPTSFPTESLGCQPVPEGGCSICGEGKCVTNPDAIFKFENQPEAPCDVLQNAGYWGYIPLDYCAFLPDLAEINVCGCSSPSDTPSSSPSTLSPSHSPTLSASPSALPTSTLAPTESEKINVLAVIYTDAFPAETSWSIQRSDNKDGEAIFDVPFRTYENTTTFKETHIIELTEGKDYRFSILDQFGDGSCCEYGTGNASLYFGTEEILSNRLLHIPGNFTSAEFRLFTAVAPETSFLSVTTTPSTGFCFPGAAKCFVRDKGEVEMKDLKLGDNVLVRGGTYEPIYSFGHRNAEVEAEFIRLSTTSTYLELSKVHMIFVGKERYLPASLVKVGDRIELSSGHYEVVKTIDKVIRKGVYAPFTPSGSIIVNGVRASSYVALQESETLLIGNFDTGLKFQILAQYFETPHRLWCSYISSCLEENYTDSGVSTWVAIPLILVQWTLHQDPSLTMLMSIPLLLIVFSMGYVCVLIFILAAIAFSFTSKMSYRLKVCQSNVTH